jgi:serine/threonine-protein kinase
MNHRRYALAVLLASSALLSAARTHAQSPSDQAAAEALFKDGRRLYDAGDYVRACPKLAESQRLDPAPGTLINLASCYEKSGRTASAWITFKLAIASSRQKGHDDWAKLAQDRAAALEPKLSRLVLVVPKESDVDGLALKRDGAEVGRAEWGTPIPVDPGPHVVEATAPHKKTWSQSVDVGDDAKTTTVTLPTLADGPGGEVPVDAHAAPGSGQRTVGLVLAGVGVVGLGASAIFGLTAMSKESDALSHCKQDTYCTPEGVSLGSDAKSAATISTITFALGAAALTGGLILYFSAPKRTEEQAPKVGLRVSPGGVGVGGTW